jgi:nucleoside-diphosphate-sugar epimerase
MRTVRRRGRRRHPSGPREGRRVAARPLKYWRLVTVLVTGGAGFGSNLVRRLQEEGDESAFMTTSPPAVGPTSKDLDVEQVEGDPRSYERVASAARGADVIFHQGALPSVPRS